MEVEKEGITLRKKGGTFWACCPFHAERTPSFMVNPQRGRFHCFGCGAHGDVVDFIMRLRGLSFKEALRYLGIEQGPLTASRRAEIEKQRQKREAIREFREWVDEKHRELSMKYRCLMRAKVLAKSEEECKKNPYACMESLWEHYLTILEEGSDEEKFKLYLSYQRSGANDTSYFEKSSTEVEV